MVHITDHDIRNMYKLFSPDYALYGFNRAPTSLSLSHYTAFTRNGDPPLKCDNSLLF